MPDDLWTRAEGVFNELAELPPLQRPLKARELCGQDHTLLSEVLSLLDSGQDHGLLDTPALNVPSLLDDSAHGLTSGHAHDNHHHPSTDTLLGTRLGEYEIRSRLGAGGMGVVYLARQDNPARDVALKVIKPGAVSASLVRRFEHEAQILARLQHPGIAQVYGAGRVRTPDGARPYFAMENVRGTPLRQFVATLTRDEKLSLLASICDAVQHAHTKGVIHRDLKPANILVTTPDPTSGTHQHDAPARAPSAVQPKILDFGVARVTEADIHATAQTFVGEIIGTLSYMSPEQVRGNPAEVDTRTDISALGVILYELLSGKLPFDPAGLSIAQAAPMILDREPIRLGAIDRTLRGDLEIIAAKALEKDRARRYASASELAEDLRRFLAHDPILARPPTTIYQLRKFARRNRTLVAAAVGGVVLLIAGVIGTGAGMVRARQAQALAETREQDALVAAAQAEQTVDFLTAILSSANPTISRGRDLTVREMVDEAAVRATSALASQPKVEFRTRLALSRTYLSLNALDGALSQAQLALALANQVFGPRTIETSEAMAAVAASRQSRDRSEESLTLAREVLGLRLSLLPEQHSLVARARMAVAKSLVDRSRYTEAEAEYRRAKAVLEHLNDPALALCSSELAEVLLRRSGGTGLTEAHAVLRESLDVVRRRGAPGEPDAATLLSALGAVLKRMKRLDEAEPALREAIMIRSRVFPPNHPATFSPRLRLIQVVLAQGRAAEARDAAQDLLEVERRALGDSSADVINTLATLGSAREALGEFAAAAEAYSHARRGSLSIQDSTHALVCLQMQINALLAGQLWAQAEEPLRDAIQQSRGISRQTGVLGLERSLAMVLGKTGRHAEQADVLRALHADLRDSAPDSDMAAQIAGDLADALHALGDPAHEAESLWRESLAGWARFKLSPWKTFRASEALAAHLDRTGRASQAAELRAAHPRPTSPEPADEHASNAPAVHSGG